MTTKIMPWFRYYSEVPRDRKLERAAAAAEVSKLTMIGAWSVILCLANDSPIRGKLLVTFQERFTVTDLVTECETDPETMQKIIDALIRYEMLEIDKEGVFTVKNWDKRQFESDSSTERVRKHRENKRKQEGETLQKRSGNGPETETESDIKQEKESLSSGVLAPLSEAFDKFSGLPTFSPNPREYVDGLEKMNAAGILPCDIEKAFTTIKASTKKYTIIGPKSIFNFAATAMSERKIGSNGNGHTKRPKMDY